jgi:hypothetical protein
MTTKHNKKRMGMKRKRKGTNGHEAQRPERRGEGTFSFPFELYL